MAVAHRHRGVAARASASSSCLFAGDTESQRRGTVRICSCMMRTHRPWQVSSCLTGRQWQRSDQCPTIGAPEPMAEPEPPLLPRSLAPSSLRACGQLVSRAPGPAVCVATSQTAGGGGEGGTTAAAEVRSHERRVGGIIITRRYARGTC